MRKSLALQAELAEEFGACVFDVTLDCEDGAPVGRRARARGHGGGMGRAGRTRRAASASAVAVRVHPVDHPAFEQDVETIVGTAAPALSPCDAGPKVDSVQALARALQWIDQVAARTGRSTPLPLHALIESPLAVRHASFDIAAHPRVQSLSFGLMDFVSAHGGAIPATAMGLGHSGGAARAPSQFPHPLVLPRQAGDRSACHAFGKVPSHCVVTEFTDVAVLEQAARQAARALGYTRMWSTSPGADSSDFGGLCPGPGGA